MDNEKNLEMEAYIKAGDVEAVRAKLDGGMSPDEKFQFYNEEFDSVFTTDCMTLAILNNQLEIVKLLVEYGVDLNPDEDSLLYLALRNGCSSIFCYFVEQGLEIEHTQKEIARLFLNMEDCDFESIKPAVKKMGLPLNLYGGECLRSAASEGNMPLVQFLLEEGVDINYHSPDMIYPYASTPIIEAARDNHFEMVKYLAEQGADISITDKYGDRPYTLAVKNKNSEMKEFIKSLEPVELHNMLEKEQSLKFYKLPPDLVKYLKTGKLKLEFPNGKLLKWAKLYSYMDTVEVKWKRKKLLSLLEEIDEYGDLMLVWYPKEAALWYIDIEHETFEPLCTWKEFIRNPEKWLHKMVEG